MNLKPFIEADTRWSTRLRIAERPGWLRTTAALLAHSGDSWFWLIGLAIAWLLGDVDTKTWVWRLIMMIIVLALLVLAIKFSVRRRRPEGEWGAVYRVSDPHSFPSGHAARAALLAVLTMTWSPDWLGNTLLIWAPFVMLARVAMGLHYLSDVIAGALLGIVTAVLAIQLF
jgi:undecaprenyl-diphosphatase